MKNNIAYISKVCGGELSPTADASRIINGFFTDSRTPSQDKLFLALRGERVDANRFVPDIINNNCCAMTDNRDNLFVGGTVIYVDDVRTALRNLAIHYRENEIPNVAVIGITGSVGKTTTKDMVALALSSSLSVYKTPGNANSQVGLPQAVLATENNVECAVLELGMSMKGEMERISRCAAPDISIVTNIGHSHIENLGSREAIRDEKLKIASFSKPGSILLLNGDEPLLRNIETNGKKVYYISDNDVCSDCFATDINESSDGVSFSANIFGKQYSVSLSVCGRHFVINSLFALASAHLLNINVEAAALKLATYQSDGKRQFVFDTNGHTVISDCYNASPESMKAALSVLAVAKGRRIAVLGDMLELGPDSPELHKLVGKYVDNSADVLVTYGTLSKNIAKGTSLKEMYSFNEGEIKELKSFLEGFINQGDTVLYKASNGMNLGEAIV